MRLIKAKAFTLVEVLLALTIIGVIATLTIPNLLTDTSSAALRTKFKATFTLFQDGLIHAENVQKHHFVDVGEVNTNDAKYSLQQYMHHHFNARRINRTEAPEGITYELKTGAQIIFPPETQATMTATGCTISEPCTLFIDVNGRSGPNEIVNCTTGTTSEALNEPCTVDEKVVADIFPIKVQRSHILPLTNAASYILNH